MSQSTDILIVKIPISEHEMDQFKDDSNLLLQKLSSELNSISDYIVDHLSDRDGAPEPGDYQVKQWQYDAQNNIGKFRLHFSINRRFCCSDQESCHTDYLDFSFILDNSFLVGQATFFDWSVSL